MRCSLISMISYFERKPVRRRAWCCTGDTHRLPIKRTNRLRLQRRSGSALRCRFLALSSTAKCRSRRCTGAINKLPLKWQILPICHCEEAIAFLTLGTSAGAVLGGMTAHDRRSCEIFHSSLFAILHMCILQKGLLRGSCSRPFAPREGNRRYQRWTTVPASPRTAAPACASDAMMACPPVLANETAALTFGSMEPGAKWPSSQ